MDDKIFFHHLIEATCPALIGAIWTPITNHYYTIITNISQVQQIQFDQFEVDSEISTNIKTRN